MLLVLLNEHAVSSDKEKHQHLLPETFQIVYPDHRKRKGKALAWKVLLSLEATTSWSCISQSGILFRKLFSQLNFITSTAVMCKKPDFPSCCLQTIAFWWEQVQFPLALILFLKQRLLLSRLSMHSSGNTGTLCPMSGFFYNQNLKIPLSLQTEILKTKRRTQCIS